MNLKFFYKHHTIIRYFRELVFPSYDRLLSILFHANFRDFHARDRSDYAPERDFDALKGKFQNPEANFYGNYRAENALFRHFYLPERINHAPEVKNQANEAKKVSPRVANRPRECPSYRTVRLLSGRFGFGLTLFEEYGHIVRNHIEARYLVFVLLHGRIHFE